MLPPACEVPMAKKKRSQQKPVNSPAEMPEGWDPFPTPTPRWLRRFILGFAGFYALLFLLMGGYGLYGAYAVVDPARAGIEDGSPDALAKALDALRDPHVFSGYAPYHGFGNDKSKVLFETVDELVARGQDYTPAQQKELLRWASHWIAAVETHKVEGDVPWLAGDVVVLQSLLERWENGLATSRMFMIYLGLVALIFGALYAIYRRMKYADKIGPLEP
jgi:hypothetical protein